MVHALASASLVWEVAIACSRGDLIHCSCGDLPVHPPDGDFKWGGCGDNVKYALKFGVDFINAKRNKKKKSKEKVSNNKCLVK